MDYSTGMFRERIPVVNPRIPPFFEGMTCVAWELSVIRADTLTFRPMSAQSSVSHAGRTTFSTLLTRYLAGEIADARWAALNNVLDSAEQSPDERAAFAAFYMDASHEQEIAEMPSMEEIKKLLEIARA